METVTSDVAGSPLVGVLLALVYVAVIIGTVVSSIAFLNSVSDERCPKCNGKVIILPGENYRHVSCGDCGYSQYQRIEFAPIYPIYW